MLGRLGRGRIAAMTKEECETWLSELLQEARGFRISEPDGWKVYDNQLVAGWLAKTQSALEAFLPTEHAIRHQWSANLVARGENYTNADADRFARSIALADASLSLLANNRLGSILDGVRAETVSEVLDQADELLDKGAFTPAAVLAGGALETHLHFLCTKHELTWDGHGSIGKYDGAIAQERRAGNEIYSKTDSKQVTAWAGMRNDAAHKPAEFKGPKELVVLMVAGIRNCIARVN